MCIKNTDGDIHASIRKCPAVCDTLIQEIQCALSDRMRDIYLGSLFMLKYVINHLEPLIVTSAALISNKRKVTKGQGFQAQWHSCRHLIYIPSDSSGV